MNHFAKTICLVISCMCFSSLSAEKPSRPASAGPPTGHDTRLLQYLLEMNEEELANLHATIERIEKMPTEERAILRQRISKLKQMDPARIEAMRADFQAIPVETRKAMRLRWMNMTPQERTDWREKLEGMSRKERSVVFQEEGFLPAHKGKGPKGPPRDEKGSPLPENRGPPPRSTSE